VVVWVEVEMEKAAADVVAERGSGEGGDGGMATSPLARICAREVVVEVEEAKAEAAVVVPRRHRLVFA
jgi:hypothetical protein